MGPSTYENAAQIDRAGNYGWPYCMGSAQAYRDRIASPTDPDNPAATTLRGANAAGYVSGGPGGNTPGWYDCDNLHNDSPNNTGLVEFPHETGTGMDAGKMRPTNVWYSRGNPDGANGCPEFPREGGAGSAPNYGADPTSLCPYAIDQGMTVMDGPVYRYDGEATDNSRRWPRYWDGRWFLHNNGGASIKHAPAARSGDRPGRRASRSTRTACATALDWDAGLHGLEVRARRRALRPGLRRLLPRRARRRASGASTTRAAPPRRGPRREAYPIGGNEVSFAKGASGGVVLRVGLRRRLAGRRPRRTRRTSTRRAGRYTATLTVTYADGSTDTGEVTFDVIEAVDDTAPVTTATTDPADPNGTKPVTVTLAATDGGGTGVERTEYRVNGGQWQEYTGPFKRSEPDTYVVQYRSVDRANNTEDAQGAHVHDLRDPELRRPTSTTSSTGPP